MRPAIEDIPVVILCGGEGARLHEETRYRPKALLEVGPDPMLVHIMRIYAAYGFRRFILCLGYRGAMIKEFFLNYDRRQRDVKLSLSSGEISFLTDGMIEDWEIIFAETGDKTQTGARIKQVERYVDAPLFMATYGDGLANVDLEDLLSFHFRHNGIATLTGVEAASQFGLLRTEGDRVVGFEEKPKLKGRINGGYFVFDRAFFDYLSDDADCILEREPLERLTADGQLHVYEHNGFWQCLDTFKDFKLMNDLWAAGPAPWVIRR